MKVFSTRLLTAACYTALVYLGLSLSGCDRPLLNAQTATPAPNPQVTYNATNTSLVWSDGFQTSDWMQHWSFRKNGDWGLKNITAHATPRDKFSNVLRVRYPAGSASPMVTRKTGAPVGGAQFFADLGMQPQNALRLSYYLRFSKNFNFVKGGKLPGLFGGTVNDGRKIPDGTNGFSTRYMWRKDGDGEVYAYLPTSSEHGTSIGRGNWRFKPGNWHHVEQEVILNQPGKKDGRIRVWVDGKQVLAKDKLTFRSTDKLKIEGIFFSTFFGGGTPAWATPKDVYVDFADFSVSLVK
jgi:hypothetical protein